MMYWLLKEPLTHFLAMGLGLFLLYNALNPIQADDSGITIVVDRAHLLNFIQYRAKRFDSVNVSAQLDAMPDDVKTRLIDDYVREEVLYREATALQLDKNDTVARQRLIQQMRYLTQSFISAGLTFTEAELHAYQTDHADRYKEPAKVTFTHVFFSTESRPLSEAQALAQRQLSELNQQQIPFHQAMAHGERFLYHRNYVNKDADLIASHFGEALQQAVFGLNASESQWQGPYQSPYGVHLVLVTQHSPEYSPPLEEVKVRVAQDLHQQRRQEQLELAIKRMIEGYDIEVSAALTTVNTAVDG